jgi:hypothetical protein
VFLHYLAYFYHNLKVCLFLTIVSTMRHLEIRLINLNPDWLYSLRNKILIMPKLRKHLYFITSFRYHPHISLSVHEKYLLLNSFFIKSADYQVDIYHLYIQLQVDHEC